MRIYEQLIDLDNKDSIQDFEQVSFDAANSNILGRLSQQAPYLPSHLAVIRDSADVCRMDQVFTP